MEELYRHQREFLARNPKRRLLCWDTGSGKTRAAIEWAKQNFATRILVICPKALKEKWRRDILKYAGNQLNPWLILSKEEFRKLHKEISAHEVVIVDEAHYFSGMKSQMSKALFWYINKRQVEFVLLLTATPYMSTPWNIYTLARHLGYNWNYMSWKLQYFYEIRMGMRWVLKIRNDIEDEMAEKVKEIGDVVRLDECADIPQQVFEVEELLLTPEQTAAKKEIIEINPIVRFTKYHEIENGILKSDGYTPDKTYASLKNERIKEYCETTDKVAVVCRYNLQIDMLAKELGGIGKPVFIIRGDVKDRDGVVQAIEKSNQCVVLIQADCSEGYELPSIGLIIFASLSFSYKNYKQVTGRFLRINALKKNVYIHLVIPGGVDEAVYEAVKNKEDFDISIYARQAV